MKLLCCGDLHLREKTPQSRLDNYFETQGKKLDFIFELAAGNSEEIVIIFPGDIFNSNPPTCFLTQWIIDKIGHTENLWSIYTVFGQHDMAHHSLKSLDRTGLAILEAANAVTILNTEGTKIDYGVVLYGCHYGQEVPRVKRKKKQINILVIHKMIIEKPLWPGHVAISDTGFLDKYKEYDLIISGDNHQFFVTQVEDRFLVNCGSMMRMTAGQMDHEPAVVLYDTETKEIEIIDIPIAPAEEVLSREHINSSKERSERLEAFVKSLRSDYDVELDFRKNLQEYFEINKIRESVRELIQENL